MTFGLAALFGVDLFDSSAYHKFARRGQLHVPGRDGRDRGSARTDLPLCALCGDSAPRGRALAHGGARSSDGPAQPLRVDRGDRSRAAGDPRRHALGARGATGVGAPRPSGRGWTRRWPHPRSSGRASPRADVPSARSGTESVAAAGRSSDSNSAASFSAGRTPARPIARRRAPAGVPLASPRPRPVRSPDLLERPLPRSARCPSNSRTCTRSARTWDSPEFDRPSPPSTPDRDPRNSVVARIPDLDADLDHDWSEEWTDRQLRSHSSSGSTVGGGASSSPGGPLVGERSRRTGRSAKIVRGGPDVRRSAPDGLPHPTFRGGELVRERARSAGSAWWWKRTRCRSSGGSEPLLPLRRRTPTRRSSRARAPCWSTGTTPSSRSVACCSPPRDGPPPSRRGGRRGTTAHVRRPLPEVRGRGAPAVSHRHPTARSESDPVHHAPPQTLSADGLDDAVRGGWRRDTMTETFLLLQLDSEGSPSTRRSPRSSRTWASVRRPRDTTSSTSGGVPPAVRETLEFADRIQEALRGSRVSFPDRIDGGVKPAEPGGRERRAPREETARAFRYTGPRWWSSGSNRLRTRRRSGSWTTRPRSSASPPTCTGRRPAVSTPARRRTITWRSCPDLVRRRSRRPTWSLAELDAVAFAQGPGLGPCLRAGRRWRACSPSPGIKPSRPGEPLRRARRDRPSR